MPRRVGQGKTDLSPPALARRVERQPRALDAAGEGRRRASCAYVAGPRSCGRTGPRDDAERRVAGDDGLDEARDVGRAGRADEHGRAAGGAARTCVFFLLSLRASAPGRFLVG